MTDNKEMPERVWIRKHGDLEEITSPEEIERLGTQDECALYVRADEVESEERLLKLMQRWFYAYDYELSGFHSSQVEYITKQIFENYILIKRTGG